VEAVVQLVWLHHVVAHVDHVEEDAQVLVVVLEVLGDDVGEFELANFDQIEEKDVQGFLVLFVDVFVVVAEVVGDSLLDHVVQQLLDRILFDALEHEHLFEELFQVDQLIFLFVY